MSSNDGCETGSSSHVEYLKNQLALARREINNLRQQLKTNIHVYKKECEEINRKIENWRCLGCRNRHVNAAEGDRISENHNEGADCDLPLKYIGLINTHFPEKRGTPRQPGICADMIAKLTLSNEVFTNPSHALEGLQEFSHMWILFHFHKNDSSSHVRAKVSPPRLNGLRTGVFASRAPHRPCPVGLSLVRIDRIMDDTIYFSGVDMVDGTPVLDIKPYIPQYDSPALTGFHDPEYGQRDFSSPVVDVAETRAERAQGQSSSVASSSATAVGYVTEELDNMNVRQLDGEENNRRQELVLGAVSNSSHSRHSLEESFYNSRSSSRMGEREAPDGEEEESPSQLPISNSSLPVVNTPEGHIRVPSWIDDPPVSTLTVTFKNRALIQLNELGSEGEEKRRIITNILREDPRSVYLRERWSSHCYVFRIAGLYVYCAFNDTQHTVTVYQIFQNASTEGDE